MKRTRKIIAAGLSIIGLASCQQKAIPEQSVEMITHTVSVSDEPWAEEVKSAYTPGVGIALSGDETMAVGYADATAMNDGKNVLTGIVQATKNSSNYTFSHPAIDGAGAYSYYYVMPYNAKSKMNSAKTAMYVVLDATQYPSASSFDPNQDYLIAKPSLSVSTQQSEVSASSLQFKRICAPLKLVLSDSEGEIGSDKIRSVTLSFPLTANTEKKNNLINLIYLKFNESCTNSGINSWGDVDKAQCSNSVTASYESGLSANAQGKFDIWYMVVPVTKPAGTEMTVSVVTDTKTIKRTVILNSELALSSAKINELRFNISGSEYSSQVNNDYWAIYNAGLDITIGDLTINKTTHPGATLVYKDAYTTNEDDFRKTLQKKGLFFLDTYHNSDGTDASDDCLDLTSHWKIGSTDVSGQDKAVIIGRYTNMQSKVKMNGAYCLYTESCDTYIKNLNISSDLESSAGNYLFCTSTNQAVDVSKVVFEDCSLTTYKSGFSFAPDNSYTVKNLSFNNCIIKMAGSASGYQFIRNNKSNSASPSSDGYGKMENVSINNCVIYSESAMSETGKRVIIDLGCGTDNYLFKTTNLNINFTHNTCYNMMGQSNILIRAYLAKSANIQNNFFYMDGGSQTKSTYIFGVYVVNNSSSESSSFVIKNNAATTKSETARWTWKFVKAQDYTTSNNKSLANENLGTLGISSANMDTGKIVLNSSNANISATSAGADTSKMLWLR